MKPSSAESGDVPKKTSDLDLEFPVDPTFVSEPPIVSADALLRMMIAANSSRPGAKNKRRHKKCDVEFIL